MNEWFETHVVSAWTPGATGIWTLVAVVLLGWWKGLPAVLDAFERRQSGIEARTTALLDAQAARFNSQLAAADARHDECMAGQKLLREEMSQIRRENAELWGVINAIKQGNLSTQTVVAKAVKGDES